MGDARREDGLRTRSARGAERAAARTSRAMSSSDCKAFIGSADDNVVESDQGEREFGT